MSAPGNPGTPAPNPLAMPGPQMPDAHGPLAQSIGDAHSAAATQLGKLQEAKGMVTHIRSALDGLAALGEAVSPEDVIKAAGGIVGKGGDPMQMATLLADMPQGGQALASWVAQHDTALKANEQQLDQQLGALRHQAGVAALHGIAMHHIGERFAASGAAATPGPEPEPEGEPNALVPA